MAAANLVARFSGPSNQGFQLAHNAGYVQNTFNVTHAGTDERLSVDHLPTAAQAPFDASSKQDDPLCLEDTRTEVLKRIRAWAYGEEGSCIFWLNGMAGTGKSTIARTISREFSNRGDLGASFFFARGGGDVAHAGMFFTSIAKQLAITRPDVKPFMSEAVQNQPDIASKSRNDQWMKLIMQPLGRMQASPQQPVLVIVVDALDECDNDNDMKGIVAALVYAQDVASVKLRIVITSRPETPIRLGFKKMPEILHQDLLLHEQPREVVDADICLFFYSVFEEIKEVHGLSEEWPGVDIVNQLVHLSAGLFIFAATVCRFVQEYDQAAEDSLKLFLPDNDRDIIVAVDDLDEAKGEATFFLDSIYSQILERSRPHTTYRVVHPSTLRETLGAVAALSEPLPVAALASLLCIRHADLYQRLNRLHSVVCVPDKDKYSDVPVRLFHTSFRDFLFDRRRCSNLDFFVAKREAHYRLLQQCLQTMASTLHRNMCGLQHLGVLVSEVAPSLIDANIPLHAQYACRHWFDHVDNSQVSLDDNGDVHCFLQKYCLYWLEVMSLVGRIPEAMTMMMKLDTMVDMKKSPELQSLAQDTLRFIRTFQPVLSEAPLQLYSAGLIFSPSHSMIAKSFGGEASVNVEVVTQISEEWNACIQTLEGHSNRVTSVVFSRNGLRVASGSDDETVRLWDVQTGQCEQTLEGHSNWVSSVVFSSNGLRVASGSRDKTVRVWDVQTGQCEHTLQGHSDEVNSVVFSPDGSQVASGSEDKTVRVWDVQTGQCKHTLEGHSGSINTVVFSSNGLRVASGSDDETVRVWDVQTGWCQQTLKGHSGWVRSVVFSRNGLHVASGSEDKLVRVWDVQTGQCEHTLKGHSGWVRSVMFSPDGSRVVSSSDDKTVRVWDAQTGQSEHTLEGHSESINTVVFSSNGLRVASGSDDKTVRVWDVQTGRCQQTLKGHSGSVSSVVFSHDGSRVVSGSWDKTVRVWDVRTDRCEYTLEGHSESINNIVFSRDGLQVASGSDDKTVRVWDAQTGQCQHTLKGHSDKVNSVVFSPDGSRVASGSDDETVRMWNAQTGHCEYTLEGHSGSINSVVFSSNGLRVASGSDDETVRLWDMQTGRCQQTLKGHSGSVSSVVFSHDGSRVVSGSWDKTVRVWDVQTGQCQHTLKGHSSSVSSVVFSRDGLQVASGSWDKTVRVWDVASWTETFCHDASTIELAFDFSDDSSQILVNGSLFSLPSQTLLSSTTARTPGPSANLSLSGFVIKENWITLSYQRILWLPPEYRPRDWPRDCASNSDTIAIGSGTGRVTIVRCIATRSSSS